jgi:hypothetical protein
LIAVAVTVCLGKTESKRQMRQTLKTDPLFQKFWRRLSRRRCTSDNWISTAPAVLDRYPCGVTGRVAHPVRSIAVSGTLIADDLNRTKFQL